MKIRSSINRLAFALLLLALSACKPAAQETVSHAPTAGSTPQRYEIDEYCLRAAYPQIRDIKWRKDGAATIELEDGQEIPFDMTAIPPGRLSASVRQSLNQRYPLEPARPDTPTGFAPGRQRPYEFLDALYGTTKEAVASNLSTVDFMGRPVRLAPPAAAALERVARKLRQGKVAHPELLRTEGGFAWRKIAGENALSSHAYGIAIDLSAKHAPYWRWSRQMPHPLQKTYPPEIVKAFEDEGFIWGGKWHEYDLMHFEYRPEIICKARLLSKQSGSDESTLGFSAGSDSHYVKSSPDSSDPYTAIPRP